jgi:hypothetical protein
MEEIRDGTFDQNPRLVKLNLDGNSIVLMPNPFGPATPNIALFNSWFGFHDCALVGSYPYFAGFVSMKKIVFAGEPCNLLDATDFPESLEVLDVRWAELSEFPMFSNSTPLLRQLRISSNKIDTVPLKNNEKLTKLTTLEFSNNLLSTFPNLSHNKLLEVLKFDRNIQTIIPRNYISTLQMLIFLMLKDNLLTEFPDCSNLSSLEVLDISFNKIEHAG